MSSTSSLLPLVAGSAAVAGVARRYQLSAPLLLVVVGLGVSYIPGVPNYTIDPEVVLPLVLPPLLYTSALDSSLCSLKRNLRPVALLSVGYVLFSTIAVGLVMHAVVPGLPLPAAFVLGAVVAPPDAVAATAVARKVGLPRRIVTILQGESLANDATAITAYRVALAAAVGEGFSWGTAVGEFLLAALGGTAVGLAMMWPLRWLRGKLSDPLLLNTFSLLVPFVAYGAAEAFDASGVIAVVVVGLYLGHYAYKVDFALRLQEDAVWAMVTFVLESVVFALIGLQLPVVLRALGDAYTGLQLFGWAVLILAAVIGFRLVWVWPATYLPFVLSPRIRRREPVPDWTRPVIVGWAAMRGVVSMAVAFSIPETTHDGSPFPDRDLILYLTFVVVIGTLLIHGVTLPKLVRLLPLPERDPQREILIEAQAQHDASDAAEQRLDDLLQDPANRLPGPLEERLRRVMDRRRNGVWERLGAPVSDDTGESADAVYRRLGREAIDTERQTFVGLRDTGRIDDELYRRLVHQLDLEEALVAHQDE